MVYDDAQSYDFKSEVDAHGAGVEVSILGGREVHDFEVEDKSDDKGREDEESNPEDQDNAMVAE